MASSISDPLSIVDDLLGSKKSWIADFWTKPVTIEEFATSLDHMRGVPLSPRQMEFIKGWLGDDPVNLFSKTTKRKNIGVACWGKGSPASGTILTLPDGTHDTIDHISESGEELKTLAFNGEDHTLVEVDTSAPFKYGRGSCVRVITRTGRQIDVFVEHQFLTTKSLEMHHKFIASNGRIGKTGVEMWCSIRDLDIGDLIALPARLRSPGTVNAPDTGRYIGYILGDGAASVPAQSPRLKAEPEEVRQEIRELYCRLSGGNVPSEWPDRTCMWFGSTHTPWETLRGENRVYEIANKYGLVGKSAHTKHIPEECFKFDDDSIWELLGGLWTTDGWVCPVANSKSTTRRTWEAGYSSVSEKLVRGIAELLHRQGIVAKLRKKTQTYRGEPYLTWTVKICERQMLVPFLRRIRLVGPKGIRVSEALAEIGAALPGPGTPRRATSAVYWDRIERIEPLGERDYYDMHVEDVGNYEAHGLLHHNSGKNMVGTLLQAYVFYVLLCMRDPFRYFGFPDSESIDLINVASSAAQAQRNFYSKFTRRLLKWKWLNSNYELVKSGKVLNKPPSQSRGSITINEDYLEYSGGIKCISAHSDSKGYEGYSVIMFTMDEASSWETEYIQTENGDLVAVSKAHSIFDTLRTSAVSRSWKWLGLIISYPRLEDDFTLEMAQSIKDGKMDGYADIAATWEVKPWDLWSNKETFTHVVQRPWGTFELHPPKDFEEEFRLYPQQSELKYACVPSRTKAYFIYNNLKIHECANASALPIARLRKLEILAATPGGNKQSAYIGYDLLDVFEPNPAFDYYAHIDLSISSDSAILGIGHGEPYTAQVKLTAEDGEILHEQITQRVVIDQIIAWVPDQVHLVSQLNVDDILKKLDEKIKFRYIGYDMWNSAYVLEKAARNGKRCGSHNVNNRDYFLLRGLIYANAISYPADPELILELEKLLWTGKRVDHGIIQGKDRADTIAGISSYILGEEGERRHKFSYSFR